MQDITTLNNKTPQEKATLRQPGVYSNNRKSSGRLRSYDGQYHIAQDFPNLELDYPSYFTTTEFVINKK
jgi:hypothetical protein